MKYIVMAGLYLVAIGGLVLVMGIKNDVQFQERRQQKLMQVHNQLEEDVRVLESEWALLTAPDRLQQWGERLGLVPIDIEQMITVPEWHNADKSWEALRP